MTTPPLLRRTLLRVLLCGLVAAAFSVGVAPAEANLGAEGEVTNETEPEEPGAVQSGGEDPEQELSGYRASLYPTHAPTERKNLNGTNSLVGVGFSRDVTVDEIVVDTIEMPYPVLLYTREADEMFVLGGAPLAIANFVSFVDGLPIHRSAYHRTGRPLRLRSRIRRHHRQRAHQWCAIRCYQHREYRSPERHADRSSNPRSSCPQFRYSFH